MKLKLQAFNDDGERLSEYIVDTAAVRTIIENSKDLTGREVFQNLAQYQGIKDVLGDAADEFKSLEADVKGMINEKAKAAYGETWEAIAGNGFKISRSKTGSVFEAGDYDAVDPQFVEVKQSIKKDEVEDFIKANSKLPDGIMYNPKRGTSIRITVKDK